MEILYYTLHKNANMGKGKGMEKETKIKKILNELNINIRNKGYRCWIEAVKIVIENNKTNYSITKEIYPEIAEKLNDKSTRVERAMRNEQEKNSKEIQEYFGVRYKIDNSTLLALIVDKLESEE